MQTIPHRPIPEESFDSYAYRLLAKEKRIKQKRKSHKATIDGDTVGLIVLMYYTVFLIYGKYWFHLF